MNQENEQQKEAIEKEAERSKKITQLTREIHMIRKQLAAFYSKINYNYINKQKD